MDMLKQNLRFALRQLSRSPGFTVTVILTLALSIGVNTAIFSLVNALLLKNLPYPHPERMGTIFSHYSGAEGNGDDRHHLDGESWELLRDNVPALISGLSSGLASGVNLQSGPQVSYVRAGRVSAHYFDVLGIHPAIGQGFTDEEDRPHGPKVAVLSYGLWKNTFGANPGIVGSAISIKGEPYTVVGVLPADTTTPLNAELYTALQPSRHGEGGGSNFDVITRLRDGASWQEADSQIGRAWAIRAQHFASNNPGSHVTYYSVPLQRGETDSLRPQALALMLASGLILLIACANLAGLTLVRVTRKHNEIATRMALGATSWQVQKQLWVENLLLAFIGGTLGLAVGWLALHELLRLLPENFLPVQSVPMDVRVLGFTLLASLLTSVMFGMIPALTTRSIDLRSAIASKGTGHAGGRNSVRLRQVLISGEVALTVVLLSAAGLLIHTLVHLETLPPGFNPIGVMTGKASLDDAHYHDPAAFRTLLVQSIAAMRHIPGVEDAAVGLSLPYERVLNDGVSFNDGKQAGHEAGTDLVYVTPGYFHTLQIPFSSGRDFNAEDGPNTEQVAIVNESFAHKFYGNDNPVGHYLNRKMRIVGVVADVQEQSGLNPVAPLQSEETMYIPATQVDPKGLALVHIWFQPSWIVRTSGPAPELTAQMQRALAGVDSNLPFSGFYTMNDLLAKSLSTQRVEVALLGTMALLALLLSAIGIFALVANIVVQRTREIGIRIALGSSISEAMLRVGGSGVAASALGLLLGLGLSAFALRTMRSVLYGVQVYDTPSILAVLCALTAVTLVATVVPVLKIARVDPAKTLREE